MAARRWIELWRNESARRRREENAALLAMPEPDPVPGVDDTLTLTVRPNVRSRTNTSSASFVSPRTSFRDDETKATNLPVEEIEPWSEGPTAFRSRRSA